MNQEVFVKDLNDIVEQLKNDKLNQFLQKDEIFEKLVIFISDETNIPKLFSRWLLKTLFWLAKVGIDHVNEKVLDKIKFYLNKNPRLLKLISIFNEKIEKEIENKNIVQYITTNDERPSITKNADVVLQVLLKMHENQSALVDEIKKSTDSLVALIEEQVIVTPTLKTKTIESTKGYDKFKYISNFIAFMPREEEYELLNTFIDDDSLFSWQVLSGASGSGKSRLALEYCKSLPFYWEKGFYDVETLEQFYSWSPLYNTFIVIDNVGTKIDFVKRLIELLLENSENFLFKVRILLLERELKIPNNWYENTLIGGEDNNLIDYQYKEPYPISNLNKRNLAKIIRTFHDYSGSDEKLLKMLKDFDNEMRPLYAAIFGYLLQSTSGTDIDLKPLITNISDRYWKEEKIDEKHYLFIALITIIERLNPSDLESDLFPSEEELNEHWLEITMGQGSGDSTFTGILPHIIGEAFVLEVLKISTPLIEKLGSQRLKLERTSKFIEYCWQHYADQMAWFTARCYRDFSTHEMNETLCSDEKIARLDYEDNKTLLNFPAIYFMFIYKLKSRARAEESLENFKQVILKKQNKYWSFAYITACVVLFEKYVEDRDFAASKSLFRNTSHLEIEEFPGYPMLNLVLSGVSSWLVQDDYVLAEKEFKAALIFLNDNLDLPQFRKFIILFENIYISDKDLKGFSNDIDFIINTYEKFEKIADKKENDSYFMPLYKLANNYLIFLKQNGKEEKLSEIWNEIIIRIVQSNSKELTDIGARIVLNGIGYFEMTDPFDFFNVGGKLLYFHYKNNSLETSHDLALYLHEYAKHCPESIYLKEEMNFYKNLLDIPMNPENSKKFAKLMQIEYNHLIDKYKNDIDNLPPERVHRFDPNQLTKARESREEDNGDFL